MNKRYVMERQLERAEAKLAQTEEELEALEEEIDYMKTLQEQQSSVCCELRAKLKDLGS